MNLPTYKNFEEKAPYFSKGSYKIDNDVEYESSLQGILKMSSRPEYIFRGVSDAKFKMYNHAQREWISIINNIDQKEDFFYNKFITDKILKCKEWNKGTIPNLLQTYNISENDSLAYLALEVIR